MGSVCRVVCYAAYFVVKFIYTSTLPYFYCETVAYAFQGTEKSHILGCKFERNQVQLGLTTCVVPGRQVLHRAGCGSPCSVKIMSI